MPSVLRAARPAAVAVWTTLAGCAGDGARAHPSDTVAAVGEARVRVASPASTAAGSRAAPGACPSREFAAFLAAFSEGPLVQQRFTHDPLDYRWVEDAGRGPEPVRRSMPADSIRDTLYLSAAQRTRDGLQVHVDSAQASRRVVTLFKPDTDYQLEYTFERRADGCWELTRYDNQSL